MIAILFATYGAVFVAEIVGDKLLYTTGVLAQTWLRPQRLRHRQQKAPAPPAKQ